jgi:regulator of sigma E protease
LTFASSDPSWGMITFYSLMVLIGVNLIILAHEWGHFVVARWCGVKCEKFYVWFDIFGWKICRFKWGETEYGLGVLPLGGYVKMLGQEDNPARLREELERAKAARNAGDSAQGNAEGAANSPSDAIDLEAAERALYDPRSYLAQSVPRLLAII